MKQSKYYAVKNGYKPGIYENWVDCNTQIKGFKRPIFKKCDTMEEAQNFIKEDSAETLKEEKCTICKQIMNEMDENMYCIRCNISCYHSVCILAKGNFTKEEDRYFRKTLLCDGCAKASKIDNNENGREDGLEEEYNEEGLLTNNKTDLDFLIESLLEDENKSLKRLTTTHKLREGKDNTFQTNLTDEEVCDKRSITNNQNDTNMMLKSKELRTGNKKFEDYIIDKRKLYKDNNQHYSRILEEIRNIKEEMITKEKLLTYLLNETEYLKSMIIKHKISHTQVMKEDKWTQTNNTMDKQTKGIPDRSDDSVKVKQKEQPEVNHTKMNKDGNRRSIYFYNSNRNKTEQSQEYQYSYYIGGMDIGITPENLFEDIKNHLISTNYNIGKGFNVICYRLKSKKKTETSFCVKTNVNCFQLLNEIKNWSDHGYIRIFKGILREIIIDKIYESKIEQLHNNGEITSKYLTNITTQLKNTYEHNTEIEENITINEIITGIIDKVEKGLPNNYDNIDKEEETTLPQIKGFITETDKKIQEDRENYIRDEYITENNNVEEKTIDEYKSIITDILNKSFNPTRKLEDKTKPTVSEQNITKYNLIRLDTIQYDEYDQTKEGNNISNISLSSLQVHETIKSKKIKPMETLLNKNENTNIYDNLVCENENMTKENSEFRQNDDRNLKSKTNIKEEDYKINSTPTQSGLSKQTEQDIKIIDRDQLNKDTNISQIKTIDKKLNKENLILELETNLDNSQINISSQNFSKFGRQYKPTNKHN